MVLKKNQEFTILLTPVNCAGHINASLGFLKRVVQLIGDCRIVVATIGEIVPSNLQWYKDKPVEMVTIMRQTTDHDEGELSLSRNRPIIEDSIDLVRKSENRSQLESVVDLQRRVQARFMADAKSVDKDFAHLIDELKPDVIIADLFYGLPAIVMQTEVPWVLFYSVQPLGLVNSKLAGGEKPPMYMSSRILNKNQRQRLRERNPEKYKELIESWDRERVAFRKAYERYESVWQEYARATKQVHLLAGSDQFTLRSPFMNVYMYPKALDYVQDDDLFEMSSDWFNCETTITLDRLKIEPEVEQFWEDRIRRLRDLPGNANKPLVFFSLGSPVSCDEKIMSRYIKILSEDTNRLYVVSKGAYGFKYQLNYSNMLGANFLPQVHLLQKVDAAIINGGNNSITECMYLGVPCLVLPVFGDQFDNAQRFEDLQLGRKLDVFKCSREELFAALDDILSNKELNARIREISSQMRARDECGKTARALIQKLAKLDGSKIFHLAL